MREQSNLRVLVADDDSHMLDAICATIESTWSGADITTANDGLEVMKAMKDMNGAFDLLILDIHMPRMGGIEVLTEINRTFPGIRTLAVSGGLGASFDKGPILEMARFLGATAILQKPFSSEELHRAVRDILPE